MGPGVKMRWGRTIGAVAAVGAMLVSAGPAAASSFPTSARLIDDGCPGTVFGAGNGTIRMGCEQTTDLLGNTFDNFLTQGQLSLLQPLQRYTISLLWQDRLLLQRCVSAYVGSFTSTLIGGGSFGTLTNVVDFEPMFPAAADPPRGFNMYVVVKPTNNVGAIVAGPLPCTVTVNVGKSDPQDCPAF